VKNLEVEKIINKANENIKKGVVIATGIGVFAAISDGTNILLRRRVEKESPIYPKDLSGKWELPGGAMELNDLGEEYSSSFRNTLIREVEEETGLKIADVPKIVLLPAVLKRSSIEKLGLIDFAFVVPILYPISYTMYVKYNTPEYEAKLKKGEIRWIPIKKIDKVEIVSERMKYLLNIAIDYVKQHP
jgi:8-oxo-dGTP pyrophosphatase MutT (NUDIX family)